MQESNQTEDICFVCLESHDKLLRDICACHSCIHVHCLVKLVNVNHSSKCRVCLQDIRGLQIQTRYQLKRLTRLVVFADVVSLLTLSVFVILLVSSMNQPDLIWVLPYSTSWCVLLVCFLCLLHAMIHRHYDGQYFEMRERFVWNPLARSGSRFEEHHDV